MDLTCPEHKRYKGKGKPRSPCGYCWFIFLTEHPDYELDQKDLRLMFLGLMWAQIRNAQDIKSVRSTADLLYEESRACDPCCGG